MDVASPWVAALSSTGLLAVTLWLARGLISTRLTRSVEHEFNQKIEGLRSELRSTEERFKSELREREAEIAALRGGALSALASRQAAIDKRRLEAVDLIWSDVIALHSARTLVSSMSLIKYEEAVKEVGKNNSKALAFFKAIGHGFDSEKLGQSQAYKVRPFITAPVWATLAAIRAVTLHSVHRWEILKGGAVMKDFYDQAAINKLIVTALPHFAQLVEDHGPAVYSRILEALDDRILEDVQRMIAGTEADASTLEQSAAIIKQASAIQATVSRAQAESEVG